MKKKRKQSDNKNPELKKPPKWFYLVLIAIPVIFFILLELFLRVISYGTDYEYFVSSSEYHTDKLFLNPDLPYKYFYNIEETPSVLPDGFDKVKKEDAFRVFVLGGSTTAGWPYVPNAAFSRHIKRKLELLYPDNTIEVINCGVSAINTYTINDFTNGILEQKPDLILLYAGHNEYYGALGAGSSVSLGNSRLLVHLYISLIDFKTVQLLQDVVAGIYSFFSSEDDAGEEHETLMSRMIGESLIPLNSEIYEDGVSQFEENLDDIITKITDENIPLIIGTLTSNLKDQEPFIAIQSDEETEAGDKYRKAFDELNSGSIDEAKRLFILAKELDGVRFRAPERFNEIILNKAGEYDIPVADIDSLFDSESPDNIVGYNLTVDHLHPNIEGYRLMGEAFFSEMEENNFLPKGKRINLSKIEIDSVLAERFPFTELDSTVGEMGIIILTGQYPFVKKNTPNIKMQQRKLKNYVDTVAIAVINKEMKWESAHAHLADYYFNKGDYKNFVRELNAIIEERPYYDVPYKKLISQLVDRGEVDLALPYLRKLHKFQPSYFTHKWLGQLNLYRQNYQEALTFLQQASQYSEADSQLYYNLAGVYYNLGDIRNALAAAEKSVQLNPQNRLAQQFYYQLQQLK